MSRRNIQARRSWETTEGRAGRWIIGVILLAVVLSAGFWLWYKHAEPPAPDPSKLAGRWLRTYGGYLLVFRDSAPDGRLTAAYFNPRPIKVAHSEWKLQGSQLSAFVELRDVNYPGSTYTLTYDPATDRLAGVYFQAVQRQHFEVEFQRTQ
jgi:hypothetical protein